MGKNVVYDIENSQYPLEFVYWFILNVPCIRPIIAKLVLKNDYIKCYDMLPMWLCLGMGKKKKIVCDIFRDCMPWIVTIMITHFCSGTLD